MGKKGAKECLKCDLPIMIDESKCTGCFNCMIYCSLLNYGHHNPSKSFIKVVSHDDGRNEIYFLDDCVGCGMCARMCPFGALEKVDGMNGKEE
jgi:ferredoxin